MKNRLKDNRLVQGTVCVVTLLGAFVAGSTLLKTSNAGVTTPRVYTVEAGQTYRSIATSLGLSESALACANRTSSAACPSVTANPGLGRIIQLSPVVPVVTTTTAATTTTPATTVPASTTTPATTVPATTVPATTQPPTTTTTPPTGFFNNLPVNAALPTEAQCAAQVKPRAEIRAINATYNQTRGTNSQVAGVSGNYVGTTDEILQWAACKWGINEDWVRAQAVAESYWKQNARGDFGSNLNGCAPEFRNQNPCPESIGILQVRFSSHAAAFGSASNNYADRNATKSTAYNADYLYSIMRDCFNGNMTWLNTVERGSQYAAGDMWGCFGVWFSGRWHTAAANQYISAVQGHLNSRVWTTPTFING